MIGIDTNVLVRYLVKDDPKQSPAAAALFGAFSEKSPGYVSTVVLVETYWVLKRAYKVGHNEIIKVLGDLVSSEELIVEQSDITREALRFAAQGHDFADALIVLAGRQRGCEYTATFDNRASALQGMQLLK